MNSDEMTENPIVNPTDADPAAGCEPACVQEKPARKPRKPRTPRAPKGVALTVAGNTGSDGELLPTPPGIDDGDTVDFGVELGAPDLGGGECSVVPEFRLDIKAPRFFRFFTSQGHRRRVHWLSKTGEHGTECVECQGPGCILCETQRPAEWRSGMPVLDLETCEVGLLTWGSKDQVAARPRPHTMPDLVRTGIHASEPKVLAVTKLTSTTYAFKTVPMQELAGLPLGDAEIAAYQEASSAGRVVIQVARKYDRTQILKRFPEVGRASAIGQRVRGLQPDADRLQRLRDLYGQAPTDDSE